MYNAHVHVDHFCTNNNKTMWPLMSVIIKQITDNTDMYQTGKHMHNKLRHY